MGKVHVVKPGDHLPKLGADEGFANLGVIWDHPRNAELKAVRKDVCLLNPGDQIFIPDKKPKTVTAATGKTHKLIVSQPKLRLVIAVKDAVNQPLANVACELRTETATFPLVLDENGQFEQEIPMDSESCQLVFATGEIHLLVGHLPPIEAPGGVCARLDNLGYEAEETEPDSDNDAAFRSAIEEFQCDHGVPVTGVFDTATRAKLLEVHGC